LRLPDYRHRRTLAFPVIMIYQIRATIDRTPVWQDMEIVWHFRANADPRR
jgi:hypothetical protein